MVLPSQRPGARACVPSVLYTRTDTKRSGAAIQNNTKLQPETTPPAHGTGGTPQRGPRCRAACNRRKRMVCHAPCVVLRRRGAGSEQEISKIISFSFPKSYRSMVNTLFLVFHISLFHVTRGDKKSVLVLLAKMSGLIQYGCLFKT